LELDEADFAVATPLSEQLALLRSVLGGAFEGITITDADLGAPGPRILAANDAFCRLTGYSPEELVGRDHRLLHGPDTERDVLDDLRRRLGAGEPFQGEITNYRKGGSPFRMAWRVEAIRDTDARVVGYVGFHRDASPSTDHDRTAPGRLPPRLPRTGSPRPRRASARWSSTCPRSPTRRACHPIWTSST